MNLNNFLNISYNNGKIKLIMEGWIKIKSLINKRRLINLK